MHVIQVIRIELLCLMVIVIVRVMWAIMKIRLVRSSAWLAIMAVRRAIFRIQHTACHAIQVIHIELVLLMVVMHARVIQDILKTRTVHINADSVITLVRHALGIQ